MGENVAAATTGAVDALKISREVVKACAEAKASKISAVCVTKLYQLFDYFIIASGRSDRQVQGISNKVIDELGKLGIEPISVEGLDKGHWVIVDFGDVVLHIFYEPLRSHYDLESLWSGAEPIDLKLEASGSSSSLIAA